MSILAGERFPGDATLGDELAPAPTTPAATVAPRLPPTEPVLATPLPTTLATPPTPVFRIGPVNNAVLMGVIMLLLVAEDDTAAVVLLDGTAEGRDADDCAAAGLLLAAVAAVAELFGALIEDAKVVGRLGRVLVCWLPDWK